MCISVLDRIGTCVRAAFCATRHRERVSAYRGVAAGPDRRKSRICVSRLEDVEETRHRPLFPAIQYQLSPIVGLDTVERAFLDAFTNR